jgi:ankyrin repeat protein
MPREEDNRTPLHIAVNEGHADAVRALLAAGARVRARKAVLGVGLPACLHRCVCMCAIEGPGPRG